MRLLFSGVVKGLSPGAVVLRDELEILYTRLAKTPVQRLNMNFSQQRNLLTG